MVPGSTEDRPWVSKCDTGSFTDVQVIQKPWGKKADILIITEEHV
jgi:hypothetical protein